MGRKAVGKHRSGQRLVLVGVICDFSSAEKPRVRLEHLQMVSRCKSSMYAMKALPLHLLVAYGWCLVIGGRCWFN